MTVSSETSTATHYKQLALLLTLYLAQGLPAGFITQALPAILRQYQASLVAIGWSGLILLPWGLKFLWAPLVDRHYNPLMGRSRSWILPLQLSAIMILIVIAFFEPHQLHHFGHIVLLYSLLFILSLVGATHDVATDGLATRLLKPFKLQDEADLNNPRHHSESLPAALPQSAEKQSHQSMHRQSQGNAIQAIGYRMGLILGGGVLLIMLGQVGWRASFLAIAGLVALNTIPIWRFKEPTQMQVKSAKDLTMVARPRPSIDNIQTIIDYLQRHYHYFWSTKSLKAWLIVLLTYKIADGLSSGMVKPMMVDVGVPLEKIGLWITILGSMASLLGAGTATWLMKYLTRYQALLGFNALQALTTGMYGVVTYGFDTGRLNNFAWLYAINGLEHFCASLALVAVLTTIMHYARYDKAGNDFTAQVCLLTVLGGGAHFLSGYLVNAIGYTSNFLLSMLVGIVCLLPIVLWHKTVNDEK